MAALGDAVASDPSVLTSESSFRLAELPEPSVAPGVDETALKAAGPPDFLWAWQSVYDPDRCAGSEPSATFPAALSVTNDLFPANSLEHTVSPTGWQHVPITTPQVTDWLPSRNSVFGGNVGIPDTSEIGGPTWGTWNPVTFPYATHFTR